MIAERYCDGIRWLTFDNPERLNSFTATDYRDLRLAIEHGVADPHTRVVVLTGNGRAFSAGADRSLLESDRGADRELAGDEFRSMLDAVDRCEKPLLAAVNGLAVGIGCTLLLHCDLVLMAQTARLLFPFTALGIVPEAGSSTLLLRRARWGDALWAMLSSEWIDASGAYDMGIAWRVVPDDVLVNETDRVAGILAARDPAALAATKRLLVFGRAEIIKAAIDREDAEMRALLEPGRSD